ncbi:MAG TPA: hypothetical protein VL651_15665 [Bacteroidia bacterium]|nr:hypothetical protein [Bacteroidia bacterium]
MKRIPLIAFFVLFCTGAAVAQDLSFIGLKGIKFGMSETEMKDKTIILDTTSAYKDTLTYIRNSRCLLYFRSQDQKQLSGFTASDIQYEFCDGELEYVFITVKGNDEIDNAIKELKKTFTKLGCRDQKDPTKCTQLDASAKGMRLIINIDRKTQTMNFVLIPKSPR